MKERGSTPAGAFYARQTLRQLRLEDGSYPCVKIEDAPKFGWRGVLNSIEVVNQTPQIVSRAVEIKSLYCISLQDAMIVAAAEKSRCGELLSEDLNDRQVYAGVRVRNPFMDAR